MAELRDGLKYEGELDSVLQMFAQADAKAGRPHKGVRIEDAESCMRALRAGKKERASRLISREITAVNGRDRRAAAE